VIPIEEIIRLAVPGFCIAIIWGALEVPTAWKGKATDGEEKETSGASGEIVKLIGLELPPPGEGFITVTEALPLCARSVAGTTAVNAELEA
jgi:hypothetical protein